MVSSINFFLTQRYIDDDDVNGHGKGLFLVFCSLDKWNEKLDLDL